MRALGKSRHRDDDHPRDELVLDPAGHLVSWTQRLAGRRITHIVEHRHERP